MRTWGTLVVAEVRPETDDILAEAIGRSTGRASTAPLLSVPTSPGGLQISGLTALYALASAIGEPPTVHGRWARHRPTVITCLQTIGHTGLRPPMAGDLRTLPTL